MMNGNSAYQQQILTELQDISEEHIQKLLRMIRDYKLNVLSASTQREVTSLYGIWKNRISDDIEEPLKEIREDWKNRLEDINVR